MAQTKVFLKAINKEMENEIVLFYAICCFQHSTLKRKKIATLVEWEVYSKVKLLKNYQEYKDLCTSPSTIHNCSGLQGLLCKLFFQKNVVSDNTLLLLIFFNDQQNNILYSCFKTLAQSNKRCFFHFYYYYFIFLNLCSTQTIKV